MNTTPSPWLLGWMAVGSFTAGVLYVVQTVRQLALLPQLTAVPRPSGRTWILVVLALALLLVALVVLGQDVPVR